MNTIKPVVAHAMNTYFSLTSNWIQTQITHHNRYVPIVLAGKTQNLAGEEVPEYCAISEFSGLVKQASRVGRRLFRYEPMFRLMLRKHKVRLIHAHFGNYGYSILPLVRATSLPLVTMFYGFDASILPKQNPEWRDRYRTLFAEGKLFLAEGQHMRRQLLELGCPDSKVIVQHLGINLRDYFFQPRHFTSGEPLKVLVAGRFTEKKGIPYAVEAVARVIKQGVQVKLTIIGDAYPTDENKQNKEAILSTIARHGIGEHVNLLGLLPLPELRKAYYTHHVLLSPSVHAASGDNEGGAPVILIEAGASGLPVVSSWHCDIPEVVRDGVTGLLAPERDVEKLAAHLSLLVKNPHLVTDLGIAARRHIEAEYDAVKQSARLEMIYDSVFEDR